MKRAEQEGTRREIPWRTIVAMLLLFWGNSGSASLPEDDSALRAQVRLLQELDLFLDPAWISQMESRVNPEIARQGNEPFDLATLDAWIIQLSQEFQAMGLDDGQPMPAAVRELAHGVWPSLTRADKYDGMVSFPDRNAIYLRDSVYRGRAYTVMLLAHELAHLKAEHLFLRSLAVENFKTDGVALWARSHQESQAQLLSLEALARVVYLSPNREQQSIARDAMYVLLRRMLNQAKEIGGMLSESDPRWIDATTASDFIKYGYIPLTHLEQLLETGRGSVPVVEHGPIGLNNTLHQVELEWTAKFLSDEGF